MPRTLNVITQERGYGNLEFEIDLNRFDNPEEWDNLPERDNFSIESADSIVVSGIWHALERDKRRYREFLSDNWNKLGNSSRMGNKELHQRVFRPQKRRKRVLVRTEKQTFRSERPYSWDGKYEPTPQRQIRQREEKRLKQAVGNLVSSNGFMPHSKDKAEV